MLKKLISCQLMWVLLITAIAACDQIVTVSFDSGNTQLWNDNAKLLKTIN